MGEPMTEKIFCGGFSECYDHDDDRYDRIKEKTSVAAMNIICANAGLVFQERGHSDDYDSIDVTVKALNLPRANGRTWHRPGIDIQLKCTSSPNFIENGKYLSYPLKRKNYDDLTTPGTNAPLLAVLVLPQDVSEWMSVSRHHMTIRECIFWCNISQCNRDVKNGQQSVSVRIPVNNVLDTETLYRLLDMTSRGEEIPYEIQ